MVRTSAPLGAIRNPRQVLPMLPMFGSTEPEGAKRAGAWCSRVREGAEWGPTLLPWVPEATPPENI
jgi:hypothetical protein